MDRQFGLIGFPLGHSFSKGYFSKKFKDLGLDNHFYNLFELSSINEFKELINNSKLAGLNVTIPYKQDIIPFLDSLHESAEKVGAVNVIKFKDGKLIGYNTDYPAFKQSLKEWLGSTICKALVLGTGGASKAVVAALNDLEIEFQQVSRIATIDALSYEQLFLEDELIKDHKLIINTTPLGMAPNIDACPNLPYDQLTKTHSLFDLVYNPETTLFLKKGEEMGCKIKNGLEMLHLQAELAWDIWNA